MQCYLMDVFKHWMVQHASRSWLEEPNSTNQDTTIFELGGWVRIEVNFLSVWLETQKVMEMNIIKLSGPILIFPYSIWMSHHKITT